MCIIIQQRINTRYPKINLTLNCYINIKNFFTSASERESKLNELPGFKVQIAENNYSDSLIGARMA